MSGSSSIEWTDATWNPTRGCARVSPGCERCYAERVAHRFSGTGHTYEGLTVLGKKGPRWTGHARFVPEKLGEPLRWRKPRRIFVNSMSDLFHEDVSDGQIAAVFGVMAECKRHTFQVLTKRPERAIEWFRFAERYGRAEYIQPPETTLCIAAAQRELGVCSDVIGTGATPSWPLSNVWLGVSCEDQQRADERIPLLRQCPAAVHFVSAEPLLGELDLSRHMWPLHWSWDARFKTPEEAIAAGAHAERRRQALVSAHANFLSWVIVGGESGTGARECHLDWIRSIVAQCKAAGTPVFVKQLGATIRVPDYEPIGDATSGWTPYLRVCEDDDHLVKFDRNSKGGDINEWPHDVRIRQFPEVSRG